MITVPKSQCPSCDSVYRVFVPKPIPPVESCLPCEKKPTETILQPIVSFMCPCPDPPKPVEVPIKKYIRSRVMVSCYKEFVLAVPTTKFCDVGPKCKPSI